MLDPERVAGVVKAQALRPGDIIQRRYRWTVQYAHHMPSDPGSCGAYPYRPAKPARVLVRAHHTDRGADASTATLEFTPDQLVKVARLETS